MIKLNASATVCGYINQLFDETDENKLLCIETDLTENDAQVLYSCEMEWSKKDIDDCVKGCESLIGEIEEINIKYGSLIQDGVEQVLKDEKFEFWNTYLNPFKGNIDIGSVDDDDSIALKMFLNEQLTAKEQEKYDAYVDDINKQAESRIEGIYPYGILIRCMRYYKLLSIKAPESILENERTQLVNAYVINRYGKEMTKVIGIMG